MAVGDRVSSKQDGERDKMREILSSLVYRTSGWAGCGCNRGARWVPRGLASVDWPLTMNSSVISTIDIGRRVLFQSSFKGCAGVWRTSQAKITECQFLSLLTVGWLHGTVLNPPVVPLQYRHLGTIKTRQGRPAWEQRGRDQWWWQEERKYVRWHSTGWVLKRNW